MEHETVRILMTIVIIALFVLISIFIWAAIKSISISLKNATKRREKELDKQKPKDARLICDFMGYSIWKPWIARFKYFDHEMVTTPFGCYELTDMSKKFRSDWGWLHEVSNKIGKIPFDEVDGMKEWMGKEWSDSKVNIHSTKKEVYDAIIKFINWYNDNK